MEYFNKNLLLKEIPLFAGLSEQELCLIEERATLVEYRKGELIYSQGSPASAWYYLVLGRIMVSVCHDQPRQEILEYLHRGKYFGIISLLTGESHSVTTRAHNDCLLLVIKKDDFDYLLKRMPVLALELTATLSRRLKRTYVHRKTIFESSIISVFSFSLRAQKNAYILNLLLSLKKETYKSVIQIEIVTYPYAHTVAERLGLAAELGVCPVAELNNDIKSASRFIMHTASGVDVLCISCEQFGDTLLKTVMNVASIFTTDYHYILLNLPGDMGEEVASLLNQSDIVHVLTSSTLYQVHRVKRLIERLQKEYHFDEAKIKVIACESAAGCGVFAENLKTFGEGVFATLPYVDEANGASVPSADTQSDKYAKAVRRIARHEGDCQLGISLGIGVAYGFCHIGVLRVLEEENIPVDIIVGSSMGAIIASLWAIGKSSEEIIGITAELKEPKYIWDLVDFTFPFTGFIKGNKLYKFLKRHLGNKTFYDVKVPLKVMASELKHKESKVLESGLLIDAIMASCAMPGVFTPFKIKEEMLVDGGIINPLPTEPLFEMGVKKIIAVNVTPSKADIVNQLEKMRRESSQAHQSQKLHLLNLKNYLRNKFNTNILDILFSSFEILQSELALKEAALADVVLHPDTSGLHWLEFGKAAVFAERGEAEARRHLQRIHELVRE